MLTRDLGILHFDRGRAVPDRLTRPRDAAYLPVADRAVVLYREAAGKYRGALHGEVRRLFSGASMPEKRIAGLTKLLDSAAVWSRDDGSAMRLRREVFRRAAALHPLVASADERFPNEEKGAKQRIAAPLCESWEDIERRLWSDLPSGRRLLSFEGIQDGAALLARYNVAQVQVALYDAAEITIEARADFKTILRQAKLAGLLHTVTAPAPGEYRIVLDGPASSLRRSSRYGVSLAKFLPSLLPCADWSLRATLQTRCGPALLELSPGDGLRSHIPPPARFDSRAERRFARAWGDAPREGFTLEREGGFLNAGQKVFVPDFVLRGASGCDVYLEIVGFWTADYMTRKAETLRAFANEPIIVAVANQVRDQLPPIPHPLVVFERDLEPEKVLAVARQLVCG